MQGYHQHQHTPMWRCPYCGTYRPPFVKRTTKTAGVVVFVLLLILFVPLCWIGLLMRETKRICIDCNSKV